MTTMSLDLSDVSLIALSVCGSVNVSWGMMLYLVEEFVCPVMFLRELVISSAVTNFKLLS